jgi:hypothetical protein
MQALREEAMAIPKHLNEERKAELDSAYSAFVAATKHAGAMLAAHGMEAGEFKEADHAAGVIMEKINRLIGRRHWLG